MVEVVISSNGTRMRGDLYRPPDAGDGRLRPAVVCCHGWAHPLREAVAKTGFPQAMAAQGYFVLVFDYRGWGSSDGIPLLRDGEGVPEIVREVLDPHAWAADIRHAIDFIEGEPGVDPGRIGLAGWSLGGGMAVWTAAHDPRVKCVVAHAGAYDYRGQPADGTQFFPMWTRETLDRASTEQARGARPAGPVVIDFREWPPAAPAYRKGMQVYQVDPAVRHFAPIAFADRVTAPVMIIDAEREALWDIHRQGEATAKAVAAAGRVATEYHVIPGIDHLGIYDPASGATELALGWYGQHLKG